MITITDSAGHSLTLDDAELIVTEIGRMIEDWKQEHHPDPAAFTVRTAYDAPESGSITIKVPRAPDDLLNVLNGAQVHAPAPTSARWEGPPPKRRGRR